jgi:hypothetical protein
LNIHSGEVRLFTLPAVCPTLRLRDYHIKKRRYAMPRGHAAKREAKKPKKRDDKRLIEPPTISHTQVEVVGKRRKAKEREE